MSVRDSVPQGSGPPPQLAQAYSRAALGKESRHDGTDFYFCLYSINQSRLSGKPRGKGCKMSVASFLLGEGTVKSCAKRCG